MGEEPTASLSEIIVGWAIYLTPILIILGIVVWIAWKSRQSVKQSIALQEAAVQLQRETLQQLGRIESLLSDRREEETDSSERLPGSS